MSQNLVDSANLSKYQANYDALKRLQLNLDLTRGKPSVAQLDLANGLDAALTGELSFDQTDLRNYGGLDGLPSAKQLFADMAEVDIKSIIIGGNSSLTLMHQTMTMAMFLGLGDQQAWSQQAITPTVICPVPGYDRHFSICEHLGVKMITVPMLDDGPDMDQVEALIATDKSIRGLWCVPRFSNPTGAVYSDKTVERIAKLGQVAHPSFKVFYDNAYIVHHLDRSATPLKPITPYLAEFGTEDSVVQFGSTSKVTFAGAGVGFLSSGPAVIASMRKHLSNMTIGPDKINQAKHVKFLQNKEVLLQHMDKHADILRPKFACVSEKLEAAFAGTDLVNWTTPEGGYFVSVDVKAGLAQRIVRLAAEAGVKLTPAGATFPYGNDPSDSNIRIAPSVPPLAEVDKAMDVFVACTQLAAAEQTTA